MMHFIRPYWLWLLLPGLLYLIWIIYSHRRFNPWEKVCDSHLLSVLIEFNINRSHTFFYVILFLFYILCIFALAGPAWNKTLLLAYREVNSMMLVLDLSKAMNESDLNPDRLTRAKYKIRDLIHFVPNTQVGLVVFTEEAFIVSPLSQDANTLNVFLEELNPKIMPVSGSDSGQGLIEGYKLLQQAGVRKGDLLLITASNPTANSWETAKLIAQKGGRVHVLAMLDKTAANATIIANLQQLAKTGNGDFYFFTTDMTDIRSILVTIHGKQIINKQSSETVYSWLDAGPWFCLLLIPIALLVLREKTIYEKN